MAERDGGQPVDADMDVGGGFLPAGDLELAAARRARADKDRVPALGEQRLQAADELSVAGLDPEIDDTVDLLVGHRFGQAEARDLCSHHAAALGVAVEHDAVIAERGEVARDGQRGRAGADQGDALAVLLLRDGRQIRADIALIVGGNPLQAADRHRLRLDAAAAAGRFAGPVAGAPEDAGKDVRLPIDRPGLGIALLGNEADVFRDRRVRRARPLAIDDFMEIVRISDIGGLQYASPAERRTRSIVRPGAFSRGRRALYAAPYTRSSDDRHPRRWWFAADQDCGRGGLPPGGRHIEARQPFQHPRRGSRYGPSTTPRLAHWKAAAMRALISAGWRRVG